FKIFKVLESNVPKAPSLNAVTSARKQLLQQGCPLWSRHLSCDLIQITEDVYEWAILTIGIAYSDSHCLQALDRLRMGKQLKRTGSRGRRTSSAKTVPSKERDHSAKSLDFLARPGRSRNGQTNGTR